MTFSIVYNNYMIKSAALGHMYTSLHFCANFLPSLSLSLDILHSYDIKNFCIIIVFKLNYLYQILIIHINLEGFTCFQKISIIPKHTVFKNAININCFCYSCEYKK